MKGDTFVNDLLKLIFNATPIANIADNAASAPLTSLYLALHSADPGNGGNQGTNEATYTGYARVAVARTAGGFTVTGTAVALAGNATFGPCTGGAQTLTHWSLGAASAGATKILYSGPIGSNQGECVGTASDDTIRAPNLSGISVGNQV